YDQFGLYRSNSSYSRKAITLFKAWTLVFGCMLLIAFVTKQTEFYSRLLVGQLYVIGYVAQVALHFLVRALQIGLLRHIADHIQLAHQQAGIELGLLGHEGDQQHAPEHQRPGLEQRDGLAGIAAVAAVQAELVVAEHHPAEQQQQQHGVFRVQWSDMAPDQEHGQTHDGRNIEQRLRGRRDAVAALEDGSGLAGG
ncbi:MAG: hypothetical protein EOO29_22655, partial [Comamonadaceae bacterium]